MLTIETENIVAVWAISPHLIPLFVRMMGSNNALMHWKKRIMTIPRTAARINRVSMDGQTHGLCVPKNIASIKVPARYTFSIKYCPCNIGGALGLPERGFSEVLDIVRICRNCSGDRVGEGWPRGGEQNQELDERK